MSLLDELKVDLEKAVNNLPDAPAEKSVTHKKEAVAAQWKAGVLQEEPEEETEEIPETESEYGSEYETAVQTASGAWETAEDGETEDGYLPSEQDVTEEQEDYEAYEEEEQAEEEDIEYSSSEEYAAEEDSEKESVEYEEDRSSEVTVITEGTTIYGGIKTDTSLVVKGVIEGDVECKGVLTITGTVTGSTSASEIHINTPRLEGDVSSEGAVKIDVGTVVIGDITCAEIVIAGAVKGDVEVNGPVLIDSTAVVKGDIRAKSIQINSGAIIVDGHYSLQFADMDLDTDSFFE